MMILASGHSVQQYVFGMHVHKHCLPTQARTSNYDPSSVQRPLCGRGQRVWSERVLRPASTLQAAPDVRLSYYISLVEIVGVQCIIWEPSWQKRGSGLGQVQGLHIDGVLRRCTSSTTNVKCNEAFQVTLLGKSRLSAAKYSTNPDEQKWTALERAWSS